MKHLLAAIEKDPEFRLKKKEIDPLISLNSLIGRAPEQVAQFIQKEIQPLLMRHKKIKAAIPPVEI